MRAGKLDRRLTILRFGEIGRDALNQPIEGYAAVATVWAQQRPVRGEERFEAQQVAASQVMTFHIRYRRDLTVKDRVLYDGRTFDITDIREIGRREVSEFDCVARVDA